MTNRVRSSSSRSGQASYLSRIAGVPLQGLKSAVVFVLCTLARVSDLLAHDECGGGVFSLRKGIVCVQRMGLDDRCRGNRGTALRNTNDCRLQSISGSRLGAHTNLGRVRKGCICLLTGIVMIGDRVSMVISGVLKASANTRGSLAKVSASVW